METQTTSFKTVKAAREAGYVPIPVGYYGGEQITVKGHLLAKGPERAKSKTEWGKWGYRVPEGTEPHAIVHTRSHGRSLHYAVYRWDQVVPKRPIKQRPPVEVPILAALWAANRRAKRARDLAQVAYNSKMHGIAGHRRWEKEHCYWLKGQVLHWLVAGGVLKIVGHHRFNSGICDYCGHKLRTPFANQCFTCGSVWRDPANILIGPTGNPNAKEGGNWAEILEGGGYRFHRPCTTAEVLAETVASPERYTLDEIEAKPKAAGEPRLIDALHTIERFLEGRPTIDCYVWPARKPQPAC